MTTVLVVHPRLADFRGADPARFKPLLDSLGLRLVLADHQPTGALVPYFDELLAMPEPEAVEAGWSVLRRYLDGHPIDAVLAQTESGLPYGALVAEAFGLRGPSPRAAWLCIDKHACRRRLAEAGVAQPRFALARSAGDVRRLERELGLPLVLKAVASANQRLVTRVDARDEIEPAVARLLEGLTRSRDLERLEGLERAAGLAPSCQARRDFLVESFAEGDPLESDGLVIGSRVESFGITEQIHGSAPAFFIEGYLSPADRSALECARLEAQTRAALAAIGLSDSGYSIEFRSRGEHSSLIEVNGRLGCDEGFGDLFEAVLGVQPMYLAFLLALGEQPTTARSSLRAALAYRCCYVAGRVRGVPSHGAAERLRALGLRVGLNVAPGELTRDARDPRVHPHLAFVLAEDESSSRVAYDRARTAVDSLHFDLEQERLEQTGS